MHLRGNGTGDSCSTSRSGRSERSLGHHWGFILCLTPWKLPVANISHRTGAWRYGPGAEAEGWEGKRVTCFKGQARPWGRRGNLSREMGTEERRTEVRGEGVESGCLKASESTGPGSSSCTKTSRHGLTRRPARVEVHA